LTFAIIVKVFLSTTLIHSISGSMGFRQFFRFSGCFLDKPPGILNISCITGSCIHLSAGIGIFFKLLAFLISPLLSLISPISILTTPMSLLTSPMLFLTTPMSLLTLPPSKLTTPMLLLTSPMLTLISSNSIL
jgi:hypothetical protein